MNFSKDKLVLKVKDHSVSGELFELWKDEQFDMLVTHPQPSLDKLPSYYESDDYISHTDGKRSFFEKLYHFIKGIALKNKLHLIHSLSSKGTLLDIGAGTGEFLLICKKNGWQVTGIEPSDKAKAIAQKKGIHIETALGGLPDHAFDVITMWHVLEHVPDLNHHLDELTRLLLCQISIHWMQNYIKSIGPRMMFLFICGIFLKQLFKKYLLQKKWN